MDRISLAYGSGGKQTAELVKKIFLKNLYSEELSKLEDSAIIKNKNLKVAFTTDSYVVDPIFFPGGDIGRLCVCGTVNDISVSGAKIEAISLGFIIEEGLDISVLLKIVNSIKKTAKEAGVRIVTGDTKVVEKGKADKIFINTSGIGFFDSELNFSYSNVKKDDIIIINGDVGSHGIAVLNSRNKLGISGDIKSDVAPLNGLIDLIKRIPGIKCIKDVTRGGLITALNEISESCGFGAEIEEEKVPVADSVKSACEMLGIDPFYAANEGKIVVIASKKSAEKILVEMRKHKYGKKSAIIGRFNEDKHVSVKTLIGTVRIAQSMSGEQMPRIC
ncbi:MAG TPA: hydrogenase expression/formation protein HypE [Elusimicrobiales bacterium]|nr:hydrogenase expression/formation protein HypE [Elusimicrobiales bacterium]HOL63297.1 hydrogenase expression/formation protein HypE [Elusimicrobiales bacterium]HPO96183.1 hydrogenase expression/formation protein HypE [Elusimicrobiales bacterium]